MTTDGADPEPATATVATIVDVRFDPGEGVLRIALMGELVETGRAIAREKLLETLEHRPATVVLDLNEVIVGDDGTALLHLLDIVQRRCWSGRRHLELVATNPDIRRILDAAGL